MKPDLDSLIRFPVFKEFTAEELSAIAEQLTVTELSPGAELFDEGELGDSLYFLHLGKVQIDKQTAPGEYEVLAELSAPTIIGEMAVVRQAKRSARIVSMHACVLWEMRAEALDELAGQGNSAAYKVMRWIARNVSDRLGQTNDKLIDIYAKPYKSMMELKQRLKEIQPGIVTVGFQELDDST